MKIMLEKKDGSAKVYDCTRVIIDAKGNICCLGAGGITNDGNVSEFGAVVIGSGKDLKDKEKK